MWLVRWINDTWLPSSKPLASSMVHSGLHPSEVPRISKYLVAKSYLAPRSCFVTLRQVRQTRKKRP